MLEELRRIEEHSIGEKTKETFHIEFGKELYNKVFSGKLGEYFQKCLGDAKKSGDGLRICLRCYENAQDIAALPWEFLHNGNDFLVTNRNTLISRLPAGISKKKTSPIESILRMLVVISSPNDPGIAPLNTELEQEVILEAVDKLHRDYKMEVDFTEDATFETIEGYLNEKEYHIVHFTGHGKFDNGKGFLILEKSDGKASEVDNSAIADLLADRSVRLVVLSTCQSGKVSNKEAYADLASFLVKKNIPAVVAMQYSILDLSATKLAATFYHAIANGRPVDAALAEARIVMKNSEKSNGIDFGTPVLYLSDPECITTGNIKPEAPESFNKPMLLSDVQIIKKGFVGRRKQLRLLQKDFMSDIKRAAIIYGFGGIGKTVLATRIGLRMNKYFEGVFGMKCKAATRPEDILNEINAFLNVVGISQLNEVLHQPVPLKVKTATLISILNQKRFLIIFDNFEDCLDESRSNIASPDLGEFIRHLLNNTISNSKYIITTRYNFDPLDRRLTGAIEHISLPEMQFPETMWLMNNYPELACLDVAGKHRIYRAIGGHPWTIGQFALLAGSVSVDGLLLELAPLKRKLINFTLLKKSYSKLDEKARMLMLCASIYQEPVPVEALSWIIGDEKQQRNRKGLGIIFMALSWIKGDEKQPSPPVTEALSKLIDWGLIARQEEGEIPLYAIHTIVREFALEEFGKEKLDMKKLLVRAAQYYENIAVTTANVWDILKAREYYYQAEEWEKAFEIVRATHKYLDRWGYLELEINMMNQSIETTSGKKKAIAMKYLGNLYQRLGDLKTAEKLANESKAIFDTEGRTENDAAVIIHDKGMIEQKRGNFKEAKKLFQQSLDISEKLGDKEGIAKTYSHLARIYRDQGNYKEAVKLHEQSLRIKEELKDIEGIAKTYFQLGLIKQDQSDYKGAHKLYQQSLKIAEGVGDESVIANIFLQLGVIKQDQGDYEGAYELYQQSLKIAKELGEKNLISDILHQLGMIHCKQGNYEEAKKMYQQSIKIAESLEDKKGISQTLHQLGNLHWQQGKYEEAGKLYEESLKLKEKMGDKKGAAGTLHQLGIIQYNLSNYEEAIKLYQQSLKISEQMGYQSIFAYAQHELGKVYEKKQSPIVALEKYMIAFLILEKINDPNIQIIKNSINRLKDKMGREVFNKVMKEIMRKHGT